MNKVFHSKQMHVQRWVYNPGIKYLVEGGGVSNVRRNESTLNLNNAFACDHAIRNEKLI